VGKGKGKTCAAVGLALRAHGAKKKVCFVQFLKANTSSELLMLQELEVPVVSFKQRHPCFYKSAAIKKLKKRIPADIKIVETIVSDKGYNVVILDEMLYLLELGLITEAAILRIIKLRQRQTELILTGRTATKKIKDLADYVSTIANTKHPYKSGVLARKGIEY